MALHTFFWKWKTHLSTIMVQWRSLFWYAHNSTSQKAIYCHSSPTLWMIACNSQRVEFISLSDINGLNWIYLFKPSELSFQIGDFVWKRNDIGNFVWKLISVNFFSNHNYNIFFVLRWNSKWFWWGIKN